MLPPDSSGRNQPDAPPATNPPPTSDATATPGLVRPALPLPAHLVPQARAFAELPLLPNGRPLVPARNWWPISPGFHDRAGEDTPVTRAEVRIIVARLTRRIADLERAARKGAA